MSSTTPFFETNLRNEFEQLIALAGFLLVVVVGDGLLPWRLDRFVARDGAQTHDDEETEEERDAPDTDDESANSNPADALYHPGFADS